MDRKTGTSVAKNTSVMLAAQAVTWVSSFVLLLFLPKYLGSVDFGRLYLAISLGMILTIIIDFGGNYLIPKEVAQERGRVAELLASFAVVRLILWALCMAGLVLFSWLVGYSSTVLILVVILGVSKLFEGWMNAIRSCFQGYERMEFPSVGMIAQNVMVAAASVTALLLGAGPVVIAVIMAVGVLVNLAVCLRYLPLIVNRFSGFDLQVSVDLLKTSIPYFLWAMFSVIYFRIDAVMLSALINEQVVGWYGGAYRFFDIVMFLPSIYTTVIYPVLSRLASGSGDAYGDTFRRSLRWMIVAGIPAGVLFYFLAGDMVSLFYGLEEYGPSVAVLQLFSFGIVLVYVDFILGSAILASGNQKRWAAVGFAAILLNVALNFWMIPYADLHWGNGGLGAALSTLGTELFILSAALYMLPSRMFRGFPRLFLLKGVAAMGLMAGLILLAEYMGLGWPVQVLLALPAYAALVLGSGMIQAEERVFLRSFLEFSNMKSIVNLKSEQL